MERLRLNYPNRKHVLWDPQTTGDFGDGIGPVFGADSQADWIEHDGNRVLAVRNPEGAAFAYFNTALGFAEPGHKVRVEFTIWADRHGEIWLEYDSTDQTVSVVPDRPGAFKQTSSKPLFDKKGWTNFSFVPGTYPTH